MAALARRPPELMDDLVEEVLLRLPPGEPASLVRAALVCKRWRRLVSDPGFRRRFRELHRTPPMLGFVCRRGQATRFTPTSSFRPPHADDFPAHRYAIDARHGLFLCYDPSSAPNNHGLVVSSPITGEVRPVTAMPPFGFAFTSWRAALLCGKAGCECDHLDRPGSPFLVVFVGTKASMKRTYACVYSSEAGTWSETTLTRHPKNCVMRGRSVLVGNSLYFLYQLGSRILEYDVGKHELAVISLPPTCKAWFVS